MHKTPTTQGWPSQRLVTKCPTQSSYGFVSFGRDRARVKVRLFSHRLWILWHFSQFQHCSIPTAHYYYWLVMVTPVAVSNSYSLWFRPLDMCVIRATGFDHSLAESILVACGPFPLNSDSVWDTKCTTHLSKNKLKEKKRNYYDFGIWRLDKKSLIKIDKHGTFGLGRVQYFTYIECLDVGT